MVCGRERLALALLTMTCMLTGCPDTDVPADGADMGMTPMDENNTPGCTNTCLEGETSCLNSLFVTSCVMQDNGCRAFGNPERCAADEVCMGSVCKATDEPTECVSNCQNGDPPRCNSRGEVEVCALRDGMECFAYGDAQACGTGELCTKGNCEPISCTEAPCTEGATRCDANLIQTCQMVNGCLVFAPGKECDAGKTCMNDSCVEKTTCESECLQGEPPICNLEGAPRLCEDTNGDGCFEYVDQAACGAGKVCQKGECVDENTCTDMCNNMASVCDASGAVLVCRDTDGDGCVELDLLEDCKANNLICDDTSGQAGCVAPPMAPASVVINELFYDSPGADVDPTTMTSNSFVELRGKPGQSIANWELRLVNGKDGMTYRTVTLPSDAAIDGFGYAVITTDKRANFFNALAYTGSNVYDLIPATNTDDGIQNGPDNVELYDANGMKVDALGYGDFTATDTFTGEGTSPGRVYAGRSLGRLAGANDTNDNSVDFVSLFPTPGLDNADLVINEVYVDQPGADGVKDNIETFVELAAPIQGWINMSLDQYVLHAINGSNGMDYIFTGTDPGPVFQGATINDVANSLGQSGAEGYVVVCNIEASSALINRCSVPYEGVDFQNGPDSFVLEYQGRVIDSVAYGTFGPNDIKKGEGAPAPLKASDAGKSLNRWPFSDITKANDTNDNATDFHLASPTPARDNARP